MFNTDNKVVKILTSIEAPAIPTRTNVFTVVGAAAVCAIVALSVYFCCSSPNAVHVLHGTYCVCVVCGGGGACVRIRECPCGGLRVCVYVCVRVGVRVCGEFGYVLCA